MLFSERLPSGGLSVLGGIAIETKSAPRANLIYGAVFCATQHLRCPIHSAGPMLSWWCFGSGSMLIHGVDLLVWPDVAQRCIITGFSLMLRVTQPSNLAHSTIWELFREAKNKNLALFATFLRLGIVAHRLNRWLRRKSADNLLFGSPIPLCGDGRESLIEKKLQRRRVFCFLRQADLPQWAALSFFAHALSLIA